MDAHQDQRSLFPNAADSPERGLAYVSAVIAVIVQLQNVSPLQRKRLKAASGILEIVILDNSLFSLLSAHCFEERDSLRFPPSLSAAIIKQRKRCEQILPTAPARNAFPRTPAKSKLHSTKQISSEDFGLTSMAERKGDQ